MSFYVRLMWVNHSQTFLLTPLEDSKQAQAQDLVWREVITWDSIKVASGQNRNTHNSNCEPWGFNRAPPPQQAHVFSFHGVDSPVLNHEHCTTDPQWDTNQCWDYVDKIGEIIIQPPVYDIEVEDEIGDD